ncbi:MAG: PAQR family membrane homeostasis protein TrhA [Candidatus Promineifilaceae bacterium]|jgi:hemolysin III
MGLFHDKPSWQNPFYTLREEIANSVTHGIGAALSAAGLVVLVILAYLYGDVWQVVGFTVFGASLLILYLASTLYHAIQHRPAKRILRKFDHAAVYLLIAGTYTPFLLISLRGTIGVPLLIFIWAAAFVGVLWKLFFTGRYEVIATIIYILMGWMSIFAYRQMVTYIPPLGVALLIAGGIVYTLGVLFYALEKIPYNHAVWHLFVLGGSACHFAAVVTLL